VVQVAETEQLNPTTEILSRCLHAVIKGVKDFEITVPETFLKQQGKNKGYF
jgi:hypothetical protein